MSDLVNDPGAAVTQNDKTQLGQPLWPAFVIALAMLATLLWTGTVLWLLSRMPWFVSLLGVVATFSLVAAIAYDKFGALSRVVASADDETAEVSEPYFTWSLFKIPADSSEREAAIETANEFQAHANQGIRLVAEATTEKSTVGICPSSLEASLKSGVSPGVVALKTTSATCLAPY